MSYRHRVVILAPEAVARSRDVRELTASVAALTAEVAELRDAVARGVYLETPRVRFGAAWRAGRAPFGA